MEGTEFATPTAEAEIAESAPAQEAVEVESAPTETPVAPEENSADNGSSPSSKAVEELKAQRKRRQEAEREAAYWRGVAEAREGKSSPAAVEPERPKVPEAPPAKPRLEQFETFEQYEAANEEYLIQAAEFRIGQKYLQAQRMDAAATVAEKFQRRIDEASREDPQLLDIVNDRTLPVSRDMVPLIQESEQAPEILRWLNTNRREAQRIASLGSPIAIAREFGRIEAELRLAPKPEPPKRVSAAPEPIKIVSPVSSATIDEDNLSMEEYHRREIEKLKPRR